MINSNSNPAENTKIGSDRGVRLTIASIFIVVPLTILWGHASRSIQKTNKSSTDSTNPASVSASETDSPTGTNRDRASIDAKYRKLLVGEWFREFHGKRVLNIKKDGTGTMVIELSAFYALLFGKRLTIRLAWKIEDGHTIYHVTGGSPAEKLELAKKAWGERWDEPIVELNESRLILQNADGSKAKWVRNQ